MGAQRSELAVTGMRHHRRHYPHIMAVEKSHRQDAGGSNRKTEHDGKAMRTHGLQGRVCRGRLADSLRCVCECAP